MKNTKDVPERFTCANIMGLDAFQQTEAILGSYFARGVLPAFKKLVTSFLGGRNGVLSTF